MGPPLRRCSRPRPDAAAAGRVRDAAARRSRRRRRSRSRIRAAATACGRCRRCERPQRLLRRASTATSAASRSICDRRRPRLFSTRSLPHATWSSTAFGRPPRGGSASIPARCVARHPRLVCASISGFGQSGPYVERAAHDINYQALAGLLRPPALPGPLIGDIGAAMQAAMRILAALVRARSRPARAASIDVSIHEAALAWSMFPTTADLRQRAATTCTKRRTASGSRWARSSRSSGPASASGSAGRSDAAPARGGEERARVLREVSRRHAHPHARRVARALCGRRCVPDDDLQAGGSGGAIRTSPRAA